jgi:hypothetical protein
MGGSSGGGGGSSTSTSTVYTNADPWKGVQPYLKELYGNTNALGNQPTQFYPGQTWTNMDPLVKEGINSNLGFANQYFPNMYNQGLNSLYGQMNAMDVGNNPYVQDMNQVSANQFTRASDQAIQNMVGQFKNQVLPGITNDAVAAGGLGGSRQGVAQGLAIQGLGTNVQNMIQSGQSDLANMYAQTNLGAYGQGLQAAGAANQLLPQYAQLGLLPGQIAQQAGGIYEGYQQKAIDDAMSRWDYAQNEPWQRLSNMNAIFQGATPYAQASSKTTTQAPQPTSSPYANAAAAGLGLYGLFSGG